MCVCVCVCVLLLCSEIYPYVVIVVGLENILIIVKAVMSTPEELEVSFMVQPYYLWQTVLYQVKYRIAVGLSKEGRAITRNFITLVIMTSMGIVFFNHTLKEFCIIALAGLACDAFLQLIFFPAVLSIDLRRLEVGVLGVMIFTGQLVHLAHCIAYDVVVIALHVPELVCWYRGEGKRGREGGEGCFCECNKACSILKPHM